MTLSDRPSDRPPLTLRRIEDAVRDSWGPDTCDEHDEASWSTTHPSTGQCTSTAYVLNDLLGGRLLGAEVRHTDGTLQGHHYWNLLADGLEVDLTLDQFVHGEVVGIPDVLERIYAVPTPGAERYVVLRDRVRARLGLTG